MLIVNKLIFCNTEALESEFIMDWIDTEQTAKQDESVSSSKKSGKSKKAFNLQKQLAATIAQPQDVWGAAFEHSLAGISWPKSCNAEATWLWSTVIMEQAEVLVRAGLSAASVAKCLSDSFNDETKCMAVVSTLMNDSLESRCRQWLEEADAYPHAALGVIATIWNLPEHANREESRWLSSWLESVNDRAAEYQLRQEDCLLSNLVFHCELPLLFGLLTATSRSAAQTNASRAMDDLAEYLENSEDHIGSWLAHGATYLRAALGCVFRSRVIADHLGLRKWYPPQMKSLSVLLTHAARWSRIDGTQLLAQGQSSCAAHPIWNALCKQASVSKSIRRTLVLSGLLDGSRTDAKSINESRLPPVTCNDEEASCTLMQRGWKHRGPRVAVDFSESNVLIETVGSKGSPILRGEWTSTVERDGKKQLQLAGWEQLCWYSDDDVDYLEIEAKFGEDAKVQRQIMLVRDHRLLFTADALLCEQDGNWTMSSTLPLARGIEFQRCGKNTEAKLTSSKASTLALPLYMQEWTTSLSSGSFSTDGNSISIRNSCAGIRRLYSPVLLSLCNRHSKLPYTWRQLTVAEDLKIVARDQAVAYRVQIGNEQYAFYRNLATVRRRSFLGVHSLCEFFAGSFDKDSGEADTLIEVELNK
jgi:hypothetical protein